MATVQRDERALEALANDFYVEQLVSREEFFSARSSLTARLDVNRAKLARRDHRDVLVPFVDSTSLRAAWALGSLDWRRAIVRVSLERVEIAPATEKGRKPFDPKRVRPVWRY